jgi:hypothetical protein
VKTKHNMPKLPQIKAVTITESLEKAISVDLLEAVIPRFNPNDVSLIKVYSPRLSRSAKI